MLASPFERDFPVFGSMDMCEMMSLFVPVFQNLISWATKDLSILTAGRKTLAMPSSMAKGPTAELTFPQLPLYPMVPSAMPT